MKLHDTDEDRIEKVAELKAPRARVWRALTDAKEFGEWFGVALEGPFLPGQWTGGRMTIPGYEHVQMEVTVQRMEPEGFFSYTWHPYAIEPDVDYSLETPTLVEFHLEEMGPERTRLRVVESGFSKVPAERRALAFRKNTAGWEAQLESIAEYVGG